MLKNLLPGYKTYIAAGVLAFVAFNQFKSGDINGALQSAGMALAAVGIRVNLPFAPTAA